MTDLIEEAVAAGTPGLSDLLPPLVKQLIRNLVLCESSKLKNPSHLY